MKILSLYPEYPNTDWSFKHTLHFASKKAAVPPLGQLTESNMLPKNWRLRLVDMNVTALCVEDLEWANYAYKAIYIQKPSANKVIEMCTKH
jgi:hypothetical protein